MAIGIVIVKNKQKFDTIYSLINPEDYFDEDIIELTDIRPEMVKDAPKFYEFWPEIEDILLSYPIVGHNITYDLGVISRCLKRYGIKTPQFDYYCTLKLSRKYLDLDSYSLTDIMRKLGVKYNAHNALEDAKATFYLFQYLNEIKEIDILQQNTFVLKGYSKKEVVEEIIPDINELYGFILEIKYKNNISDKQVNLFKQWIDDNIENKVYPEMNKIISTLEYVLLEDYEKVNFIKKLSKVTSFVSKTNQYSKIELNSQILNGILKMLKTDKFITENEYSFLKKWLNYYDLPPEI